MRKMIENEKTEEGEKALHDYLRQLLKDVYYYYVFIF